MLVLTRENQDDSSEMIAVSRDRSRLVNRAVVYATGHLYVEGALLLAEQDDVQIDQFSALRITEVEEL